MKDEEKYNKLLKPCPFCGRAAKMVTQDCETPLGEPKLGYFVVCTGLQCRAIIGSWWTPEAAMIAWNRRW